MKRKIKNSTKQKIVAAFIVIVIMITSFMCSAILLVGNVKSKYKAELAIVNDTLKENERYVYEIKQSIIAGDVLSEENCELKKVYSSQPHELFATSEDIGKQIVVNLEEGSQIMKSMILNDEFGEEEREIEYESIKMSVNLQLHDYIDVRICYPNGENYIVLSKKQIKQMDEGNVLCYLWNNEEEIQMMSSAIVDAYLYEGAYLYTTKYINPELQDKSVVTYIPSLASIQLINENPNIIEIASKSLNRTLRKELENRLANSMATTVSEINWQIENNQTIIKESTNNNEGAEDNFTSYTEEESAKQNDTELGPDQGE